MDLEGFDCCAYIKVVSDNPLVKAPQLKVSQFLLLQEHIKTCISCMESIDHILNTYPQAPEAPFSAN